MGPAVEGGRHREGIAMVDAKRLEFGWFLPTAGDTTAYGKADAQVASSLELFDKA